VLPARDQTTAAAMSLSAPLDGRNQRCLHSEVLRNVRPQRLHHLASHHHGSRRVRALAAAKDDVSPSRRSRRVRRWWLCHDDAARLMARSGLVVRLRGALVLAASVVMTREVVETLRAHVPENLGVKTSLVPSVQWRG